MTQEVRIMLQVTLEIDTELSIEKIKENLEYHIKYEGLGDCLQMVDIIEIREEAEIYGNDKESPEMEEYYEKYHIDRKRQTKLEF